VSGLLAGAMPAWGWVLLAVCTIAALLAGMWIGYERGHGHAEEEARWAEQDKRWQQAQAAAARPVLVRPPVAPREGPGKHRHPGGPARHADLPKAGYLAAPGGGSPWSGTVTLPAPAPAPPWASLNPADHPGWEPPLEPTAVLPPDPCTDSAWTRQMVREMDDWIAAHIGATDGVLKEITR
jgi:hypothetical protein